MKKLILTLLVVTTLFSFNTVQLHPKDLIGTWKADDKAEIGSLSFLDEKNAVFDIGGQKFGGEEFEVDGKPFNLVYTADFSVIPIKVDFIVTDLTTKEVRKLLGIIEFIDKDTINFAIGFQGDRPQSFENKQNIRLKRIK